VALALLPVVPKENLFRFAEITGGSSSAERGVQSTGATRKLAIEHLYRAGEIFLM
jgi:hypothetical protein